MQPVVWVIIGLIFLIVMITVNRYRDEEDAIKKKNELNKGHLDKQMNFIHLGGLELGEGTEVMFNAIEDVISLTSGKRKYKLSLEQINSVSIQNVNTTMADKKFSVKGATVGGLLFGEIGASVGGFSGSDTLELKNMIINYNDKDGNLKYIILMPRYNSLKDKESVKVENDLMFEIAHDMNYVLKVMNINKPEIVSKL